VQREIIQRTKNEAELEQKRRQDIEKAAKEQELKIAREK